jgi:Ca2+-binding RTX toxin-like protein
MARQDGTDGDDILEGTQKADIVEGHGGSDIITTFSGDDAIAPGPGSDIVNPGNGNDTIEINPDVGVDTIKGFNYDGDLVVLNGFSNIDGYIDLGDFISTTDDTYTIIDLGWANEGERGVHLLRISPVHDFTEHDVAFDQRVIPAEIIDPDPAPVLIANPNIPPPPIDFGFG